jgi:fructokinase
VSRVGDDDDGRALVAALRELEVETDWVQIDPVHPTGIVAVALDSSGQPRFTIVPDVAYDFLESDAVTRKLAAGARAVCFGTLAQRRPESRAAIQRTLRAADRSLRVCDLNLRPPFYDREVIEASLRLATWLKLNDAELDELGHLLGLSSLDWPRELRQRFGLELVCVTRGERGCRVQTADDEVDLPGRRVAVVDTVGAGDAFTAALVVATLEGRPLHPAADRANRLAAAVAASAGATPRLDLRAIFPEDFP